MQKDIAVQKYQHYFSESVRLQSLVNEQAAYIEELEEALLQLSEGEFKLPFSKNYILWGDTARRTEEMQRQLEAIRAGKKPAKATGKRSGAGSSKMEDILRDAEEAAGKKRGGK